MSKKQPGYTLSEMQAAVKDSIRRMEPVHTHWRMLESLYRTGASRELTNLDVTRIIPFTVPGTFLRTVNMVLPHLSMIINSIAQRDPKFVVEPTDGDPELVEQAAEIAKAILEYFWYRTDATATLRDMTQDTIILGNGLGKTGWAWSAKTINRTGANVGLETSDLVSAAHELAVEQGFALDQNAVNSLVKLVSLTQDIVELDEPYLEYVSPYDFFVPANARRINTARWMVHRIRTSVEEIQENENFDSKAKENIKPDTGYLDKTTIDQYEDRSESLPDVFKYATIYEFYDMKYRTLSVFQLETDDMLFTGPIPYDHRFSPFVHMRNFSDGGTTFWAFGDLENIAGIQLMINEIMQVELNDLKRVGNKYFMNKKFLTPAVKKALESNKQDAVIPIPLENNDTWDSIMHSVPRMPAPADNYNMETKLQGYMQRILAITDFQMGDVNAANRVSGTASAAIEGASSTRALDKLSSVEAAAREVASRILALCQQFLTNTQAIRIAGQGAPQWLQVTAADIEGQFRVMVAGGSTSAINPATRARDGQNMITVLAPLLAQFGIDPMPMIRAGLINMGQNPDHILIQAPQPQQPQTALQVYQSTQQSSTEQQGALNGPSGTPNQVPPTDLNHAAMQQLLALGGPPVPGATQGGVM